MGKLEHCGDYAAGIAKALIEPGRGRDFRPCVFIITDGEGAFQPALSGTSPGDIGSNLARYFPCRVLALQPAGNSL